MNAHQGVVSFIWLRMNLCLPVIVMFALAFAQSLDADEIFKLTADNPTDDDQFGGSVDISGNEQFGR